MGILKAIGEGIGRAVEREVYDAAFRRGQNAEPPLTVSSQYTDTDPDARAFQKKLDERYEQGQRSVLVKIGNKIADD